MFFQNIALLFRLQLELFLIQLILQQHHDYLTLNQMVLENVLNMHHEIYQAVNIYPAKIQNQHLQTLCVKEYRNKQQQQKRRTS